MNLAKIQNILSLPISDEHKRAAILGVISEDENAITNILAMLAAERASNKALIQDMNHELSRLHAHIESPALMRRKKPFLLDQFRAFYERWASRVTPCYNNLK